jgi:hypothetical protein
MKGLSGPLTDYLRPILDTYMDAAVAIVGCSAQGLQRYSCELDVLVVGERHPQTSLKMGDVHADVFFVSEKDILKPGDPEKALSIAMAKPVRDATLVLSTGTAASAATQSASAEAARRTRLTSALKAISRAEASLAKGDTVEADFWLLASAYEYAYAVLLSREVLPCPSHILAQLRDASKSVPRSFEGFSMGGGLESASRAGCGARLEGVMVLHDLLREGRTASPDPTWSAIRTEILRAKAEELVTRVELAECYSFLGQEMVDSVLALQRRHPKSTLSSLMVGEEKLLGERLVRQLGLARSGKSIGEGTLSLKKQVALLTRK